MKNRRRNKGHGLLTNTERVALAGRWGTLIANRQQQRKAKAAAAEARGRELVAAIRNEVLAANAQPRTHSVADLYRYIREHGDGTS